MNNTRPENRQLRIAPVMTGGTSLAVWMGGVTSEIYRMLQSRPHEADDLLSATYRSLLELTNTDPMVDVITGTSAGGLNGTLLGAAWKLDLPPKEFDHIRDVWLEVGELDSLLRNPNDSDPPSLLKGQDYFQSAVAVELRRWQTIASEKAAAIAADERALAQQQAPKKQVASKGQSVEASEAETEEDGNSSRLENRRLDLLLSVTTIKGDPVYAVDDFGQRIGEQKYNHGLRFTESDFDDPAWIDKLAMASRTSASIPFVFEPSFLSVGPSKKGDPDFSKNASFATSRWAVDGGVVVNLPLGEAIERIFNQPAQGELRRVVLYVKPTPEVPERSKPDKRKEMPSITRSILTAINAPRAEGITSDIATIREHNLAVERQRAARLAMLRRTSSVRSLRIAARESWKAYMHLRSITSVSAMMDEIGDALPETAIAHQAAIEVELRRKRRESLPSSLTDLPPAKPSPSSSEDPPDSDTQDRWKWGISALEYGIAVFLGLIEDLLATDWRLQDVTAGPDGEAHPRRVLAKARFDVYDIVASLRSIRRLDSSYWRYEMQELGENASGLGEILDWVSDAYEKWPVVAKGASSDFDACFDETGRRLSDTFGFDLDRTTKSVLDALHQLGLKLGEVINSARPAIQEAAARFVPSSEGTAVVGRTYDRILTDALARMVELEEIAVEHGDKTGNGEEAGEEAGTGEAPAEGEGSNTVNRLSTWQLEMDRAAIGAILQYVSIADYSVQPTASSTLQQLLALHVVDTTSQGAVTQNEQILELMQISWDADDLIGRRTPQEKLAGPELARLGAFLKQSWRANDWMWGRMDGTIRMALLLLDPKRMRQLECLSSDVFPRIQSLANPTNNTVYSDHWELVVSQVKEELAFLDDPDLPTPRSLPFCARAVAFPMQIEICRQELPTIRAALEVSRTRGGVEGDHGRFRWAYDTATPNHGPPSPQQVPALMAKLAIGQETAGDEMTGDILSQTVTQTATVAVKALSSQHVGASWLANAVRPLRTPLTVANALVGTAVKETRIAVAITIFVLAASGALVGASAAGADVGPAVTAVAGTAFVAGIGFALVRSKMWSGLPILAFLSVFVLAVVGGDVRQVITNDVVTEQEWADGAKLQFADGAQMRFVGECCQGGDRNYSGELAVEFLSQQPIVVLPPSDGGVATWKSAIFTESTSIAYWVLLVFALLWGERLVQRWRRQTTMRWRWWGTGDQDPSPPAVRLANTDRRKLLLNSALFLVIVPLMLMNVTWLFRKVFVGDQENSVRGFIVDTSEALHEQRLWVTVLLLVVIGVFIGAAWDRTFRRFWRTTRSMWQRFLQVVNPS